MSKFRKRPVVIEAIYWNGSAFGFGNETPPEWFIVAWGNRTIDRAVIDRTNLLIATPEGLMTAHAGDWIICGVKGELYPCKPDIFAEAYEPVEPAHGEKT